MRTFRIFLSCGVSKPDENNEIILHYLFDIFRFFCYILTLDRAVNQEMHLCKEAEEEEEEEEKVEASGRYERI